jgi:hypothetical protein
MISQTNSEPQRINYSFANSEATQQDKKHTYTLTHTINSCSYNQILCNIHINP